MKRSVYRRLVRGLGLGILVLGLSGCLAGVYSKQQYGPNAFQSNIPAGRPLAEVIKQLGAPHAVYSTAKGEDVYVYNSLEGEQILWVFAKVQKRSVVILARDGKVVDSTVVPTGEGMTVLGPFMAPIFESE